MATLDFLRHSRAYLERTQPKTLRRRGIVLGFLNEDYHMSRGQSKRALESVQAARINVGPYTIRLDVAVYRNARRWLTSTNEAELHQLERMAQTGRTEMAGVASLIKDGLKRWEQVCPAEGLVVPPPPAPVEQLTAEEPPAAIAAAGRDVERDLVATINEATGKMLRRLRELETENAGLKTQVRALEEREQSRRRWKIEDLANEFPEVAALLQLFNGGQPPEKSPFPGVPPTAAATTAAPESLPTSCPMIGRSIVYTRTFDKHFRSITDARLRSKIVKSLRLLAEHGPGHPGLNHKQLRHDALGVRASEGFVIRAGDKRILYRLTEKVIEFVAVVSRANKQIYSAE